MKETVGITSTVPAEIIYAAGLIPVDLNNLFITSKDPNRLVNLAKMDGFPDTSCSWICGIYGAALENKIKKIVGVAGGDCSETIALMEVLSTKGIETITFTYPASRDKHLLQNELSAFAEKLDAAPLEIHAYKKKLDTIRKKIHLLDTLLWKENIAYGDEVRLFQLSTSDFRGEPEIFQEEIESAIQHIKKRKPIQTEIRLGIIGVPPIIKNLYSHIEINGTRIVFSEVERQFSLPSQSSSLLDSYYHYTYPYGIFARLKDIKKEIRKRKINGIIHYIQSFCFRGIEDIVLQEELDLPVLTLQGDLPCSVTETNSIRLEAFIDMLFRIKRKTR